MQIAAGDQVLEGALALDVREWNGHTKVKVEPHESYTEWFHPERGQAFDRAVVINAQNETAAHLPLNRDYGWVFERAAPVLKPGATLEIIGGTSGHHSLNYAKSNLPQIESLGFKLVSPRDPAGLPVGIPAPEVGHMPARGLDRATGNFVTYPTMPNPTKLVFVRTGG